MQSLEDLTRWKAELQNLNGDPCRFRHHLGDTATKAAPLCDANIQNSMHGCAHAFNYRLFEVIKEMTKKGAISPEEAAKYGVEIRQQKIRLFQDDANYQTGADSPDQVAGMGIRQDNIISRREEITADVLRLIEEKLVAHEENTHALRD